MRGRLLRLGENSVAGKMLLIVFHPLDCMDIIKREKKQEHPNFKEVCRRYLADEEDFSEEKLQAAGITRRFLNNADREICMDKVASYIGTILEK